MTEFSSLFLSHGAPNMGLHDSPVKQFMSNLGGKYEKPEAIVVCSAHFETDNTYVVSDPNPEMIYDFRGFEEELYQQDYPAPGHPELARTVIGLLEKAGIPVSELPNRGFDHGSWVPLALAWPEADIPIVQVSVDPNGTPEYHYKLGLALSGLREKGIMIIGTGNITHNLQPLFARGKDPELEANIEAWVQKFLDWFDQQLLDGNTNDLLNYREAAPFAEENHPTDEHLLPIFFAMGAAGPNYRARKLHSSSVFGYLAMDAWEFSSNQ